MRLIFTASIASFLTSVAAAAPLPIPTPLQACLKDLCPVEAATLARPRTPEHRHRIEVDLETRIRPLVEQTVQRVARSQSNANLRQLADELPLSTIALEDDLRVVVNTIYVIEAAFRAQDASAVDYDDATSTFRVNAERALAALRKSPRYADADESLTRAIETLVNANTFRLMELREHMPLSWIYVQNESKMGYREFVRELFAEMRASEKRVTAILPLLSHPRSEVTRRFEAGESISDHDSVDVITEYVRSAVLIDALDSADLRARMLELKRDYATDAQRAIERYRARAATPEWTTEGLTNFCLDRYRAVMESFPTIAEIRRFDRTERVPTQSTAVSLLRERGLTDGAARLIKAGVHYPPDYVRAVNDVVAQTRTDQAFSREQTEQLQRMIADARAGNGAARARTLAVFAADLVGDASEMNDLGVNCAMVEPAQLRDATFDVEISVSWQLILRAHSGRTLAHEMGHAAYFAYPVDKRPAVMVDQIACLARRHRGLETKPEHYADEDYADLVADEVVRRRGDARAAPLCEYVSADSASVAQSPDNNDTHSSTLFRLIVSAGERVSPRCEALARDAGGSNIAERCW